MQKDIQINKFTSKVFRLNIVLLFLTLLFPVSQLYAAVLPEDRADIMYHSYEGGGIEITGPSILIRKQVDDKFSFYGNYYVDNITGASIDVVATASPYEENRTEYKAGMEYLRDQVSLKTSYTHSEENDFLAQSLNFDVSQEIFGGMTTVSLGYSFGWDEVGKSTDPTFSRDVDRHSYRISLSQVLTKKLITELAVETITDEGFLNNPYRQVRYKDADNDVLGYSYEPEVYPNTRTSTALALRAAYYLPYRAALHAEYRIYEDTWGIKSSNIELKYTHPFRDKWIFDVSVRGYTQTAADFYSDLFNQQDAQNFLARDKELSTFTGGSFGFGVSYEFTKDWSFIDKGTFNFSYNHLEYQYDDFRNVTIVGVPGEEPLYFLEADIVQMYISLWY